MIRCMFLISLYVCVIVFKPLRLIIIKRDAYIGGVITSEIHYPSL